MVKININLSNRWLYSILTVVIVILAGVAISAWWTAPASGAYHNATEVKVGIGNPPIYYSLQEAITKELIGGGSDWGLCADGVCSTSGSINLTASGKCIIFYSGGKICSAT